MNERDHRIIEAAQKVFTRYGVSKTTMNDIAREAGIARQTLYNAYPGKEEVLRATVEHVSDQTFQAVQKAWTDAATFSQKLDIFFELVPLKWYDIVKSSPDAADLLEGLHAVAKQELSRDAARWVDAFSELLSKHAPHLSTVGQNQEHIAEFIHSTSINAKYNVGSRAVLESRLSILKKSVLALVGQKD